MSLKGCPLHIYQGKGWVLLRCCNGGPKGAVQCSQHTRQPIVYMAICKQRHKENTQTACFFSLFLWSKCYSGMCFPLCLSFISSLNVPYVLSSWRSSIAFICTLLSLTFSTVANSKSQLLLTVICNFYQSRCFLFSFFEGSTWKKFQCGRRHFWKTPQMFFTLLRVFFAFLMQA